MRTILNFRFAFILTLIFGLYGSNTLAQKVKPKLSVGYHQIMGETAFLAIESKFKGEDGYEPSVDLTVNVYQEVAEDSLVLRGTAITNKDGDATFVITSEMLPAVDSIITYIFQVKIEGDKRFKNVKKAVKFMTANITAEIVEQDSMVHVSALMTNALGEPVKGEKLEIRVKRLFAPLTIGESPYKTDRKGRILVAMEDSLPSYDGNLDMQVVLSSRKYGELMYQFSAPIAKLAVDESTFDQRTMWSPPTKTPLFLWIFPNLLILGVWVTIGLLIRNLFKIYKSKN